MNGESIYGTRRGPWKPTPQNASTRKGNVVYVHVLKAAGDRIDLPALPRKINSASVLGGGEIRTDVANGKFILHLPDKRDSAATAIKLEFDGSVMDIPAVTLPAPKSAKSKPVKPAFLSEAQVPMLIRSWLDLA